MTEYGVAYFGNRILQHVQSDLDEIVAAGFQSVLHTFSEVDERFYAEQMRAIVAASHARGLRVSAAPFAVAGIFGGEDASLFLAEHPEERQRDRTGRVRPAACLNSTMLRSLLRRWILAAATAGFDEILWDEPAWAFATDDGARCVCRYCRDLPEDLSPERNLVEFVSWLVEEARSHGMRSTVCLIPDELALTPGQPWAEMASIPGLASLSSDPYWKTAYLPAEKFVTDVTERVRTAIGALPVHCECWVQGFGLGEEDLPDLEIAFQAARNAGARRIWVWAFAAAGHMSELGTTSADTVWEAIKRQTAQNVGET
ncbi:hypothetical protein [uncultured Microbacterium sp.]|uniref:hypothetical protein n=1 Tax=uncultured Microbacterium sp. TaxID=191216 RepID=UPI0025F300B8|nr:hypothetical protein [uncultured Microbacterium sp.]